MQGNINNNNKISGVRRKSFELCACWQVGNQCGAGTEQKLEANPFSFPITTLILCHQIGTFESEQGTIIIVWERQVSMAFPSKPEHVAPCP